MRFVVRGIETGHADMLRAGGNDANGQPAVQVTAHGTANPCRHCLSLIPEGERMLVLAHRPFARLHPYAEVGPVFLHRTRCDRYEGYRLPAWFVHLQPAIIRGYGQDDWIRYETGHVVPGSGLTDTCTQILGDPGVEYVHIRSKFNCFQCQVDRH